MATDFYAVLDVAPDASREEIKRAYRRQVRMTHPDTAGDTEENAKAFRAVQEAWEVLGDEQKRASYDRARTRIRSGGVGGNTDFFASGASMRSDMFNEEMSNRIKTEATRLFEEVRRRQQQDVQREQEIEDLGRPTFPLYSTSLGSNINRLYMEGRMWGIAYPILRRWKTIDVWLIRIFLFLLVASNIGAIVLTAISAQTIDMLNAVLQTIMFAAFLDLVALLIAFVAGAITAVYRFTKHGLRRRNFPSVKL